MGATVNDFLNLLYSQVDKGIYVWGGDGELLDNMEHPIAWIERHETSAKDAERAIKLYQKRVADGVIGIRAFDCSGLVYWALHTLGLQKTDVSSRGLYALCDKIEKAELREGDLVFHHDGKKIVHVGVFVGNGKYIECRGRDYGVVCNTRKANYWNRFGRWKAFDTAPLPGDANCDGKVTTADASLILRYLDGQDTITPQGLINADYNRDGKVTAEDAQLIMDHIVGLQNVLVLGKSVNVRNVDHVPKSSKENRASVIGIAHKGETYRLKDIAPTGWYNIDYNGQNGYISNRADLTTII